MCRERFLKYNVSEKVEAFSTMVGAELPYCVVQSHQIHGDKLAIILDKKTTRDELEGIDALITPIKNCPIAVRTADCVPILLYDPVKEVVAAIHSGWKGTVSRLTKKVVNELQKSFEVDPSNLFAVIGPSISIDAFQVGEEVVESLYKEGFPMNIMHKYYGPKNDLNLLSGHHIDLWKANQWLLEGSGVQTENIIVSGVCTYYNKDFHSARREKNNKCPRIINVIKMF